MPRVLIAGCGFLGEAVAIAFLREGYEVIGVTHNPDSAQALTARGIPARAADLTSPDSVSDLARRVGSVDVVIHSASSGRGGEDAYRAVYRDGLVHLTRCFHQAALVFTGSTSVYAQEDGSRVSEDAPTVPGRATGRILLEAEAIALDHGGTVARLAGIYGPGRSVLLRKFLDGTARIEGDGSRVINQIHRDDAASAVVMLGMRREFGVFNVVDDCPSPQVEVYGWIASALDRPLPPTGEPDRNRKRGWTSKRVDNSRLRSLGWEPRFPSYVDALPSLLNHEASES